MASLIVLGFKQAFSLSFIALVCCTLHFCEGLEELKSELGKPTDVRLPTSIRPLYYKLNLLPYVEPERNFTVDGKVFIDLVVLSDTNRITLHIKDIRIGEKEVRVTPIEEKEVGFVSQVTTRASKNLAVIKHEYDEVREFYTIYLAPSDTLKAGKNYRLYLEFETHLNKNLHGFYRSSYKDHVTGETKWLAVSTFEPTDARRAFPCFDEPAMKAEFEITIGRRNNMSSLSNMDINYSEPVEGKEGWTWDHYNKSVPMSTYLVAFVVSDFVRRDSDRNLSTPRVSVWARKDAIDQAEYVRDISPRILTFFERYFNIPFPLPKQDMIAIPDFTSGAMENWGLITYRENAMLYDTNTSSDGSKQFIAIVVAHELAHQWFGNLVTPSWWSDIWLNEGFSSYMETLGADHVEPQYKLMDQFVLNHVQHVFSLDALDSSHPIYAPVHHPDEINQLFDTISYGKGASIIRMMNHFLTEHTFKHGLTNYLNKWKYNSTTQDDLWDALTEQAWADGTLDARNNVTVKAVMDTWTLQKGYPVIQVNRNYADNSADFTQTKFERNKNQNKTIAAEYEMYRWWVPISYATRSFNTDFEKTKPEFWIAKTDKYITQAIAVNNTDDWLIVNVQENGYYRVNYDARNWQLITEQLIANHKVIHTINRAQLLDDSLNLARAKLLPYDVAFSVTQYLKEEEHYMPWKSFLNGFGYIQTMLQRTPSYGLFKTYMRNLLENEYVKVSIIEEDEESPLVKYHRANIINWACRMNVEACVSQAIIVFNEWMDEFELLGNLTTNPVPTNLRGYLYCTAIYHGGEEEWNFLWSRFVHSNVATEKSTILGALGCSRETWILNRYLQWAITPGSGIRKQDAAMAISSVASSDLGNTLAFNFVRDKWEQIKQYFPVGSFGIARILSSISHKLTTNLELTELIRFRTEYKNDIGANVKVIDQAIESAQANIQWLNDNYKTVDAWLQKITGKPTGVI